MVKGEVHRVKDKTDLIRHYRIIPYAELTEVLKQDGCAFLEDDRKDPLKRQTIWKASRRLSEMLGEKVVAKRTFLQLRRGNEIIAQAMEGYLFSVEE